MHGHKQSGSRQLNRHWQSGGGGGKYIAIIGTTVLDRYYAYIGLPPLWDRTNLSNYDMIVPSSRKINGETATMSISYNGQTIPMEMARRNGSIVGLNGPETDIDLMSMIPVAKNGSLIVANEAFSGVCLRPGMYDYDDQKFSRIVSSSDTDYDGWTTGIQVYNVDKNTSGTVHLIWYWYNNELITSTNQPIKALEFDLDITATKSSLTLSQRNIQVYQTTYTYTNGRGETDSLELADDTGTAYWWYKGCNWWPLHYTHEPFYKYLDEFLPEELQKDKDIRLPVHGYLDGKKVF